MDRVIDVLKQQNIDLSETARATLEQYMEEILRMNESINLTAITDRDEFIQKHYVDSLLCAGDIAGKEFDRVLDLGTGAGFPGVPLAVVFPEKQFVLMDSLNKRIRIIQELCEKLGIDNVTAVHGRAEELARNKSYREKFDLCVSRAVANMSTLSEYCLPFVSVGGMFIAYKGPDCEEEVRLAAKAIKLLGGGTAMIYKPKAGQLPFEHTFVKVKKEGKTPKTYPRKAGTPSKKPIA